MKYEEAALAIDLITLDRNLYLGKYGQSTRNLENISKGGSALGLMAGSILGTVGIAGGLFGSILRKFVGNKAILEKVEKYAAGLTPKQAKQFWKQLDKSIGDKHIKNLLK